MQFLTLDYTKQKPADAKSLLETSLAAGLSGSGRRHDSFVTFETMTSGESKKQGSGLNIIYGFSPSPFGDFLLATSEQGICYLGFKKGAGRADVLKQLFETWPEAVFTENPKHVGSTAKRIFEIEPGKETRRFNLYLKGTNFQIQVWKALLRIPEGWVVSYQDIAAYIGRPKAFRAVANAIAVNPVAYLIPCHRVIAKSGKIHKYRWGLARKKALIGWEAARRT